MPGESPTHRAFSRHIKANRARRPPRPWPSARAPAMILDDFARLSPFSWAPYGPSPFPLSVNRYAPFARSEVSQSAAAARPGPAVSLSGQNSLHYGRRSEQDGRFIRITGFCRRRFAPDVETLESYAHIRAQTLQDLGNSAAPCRVPRRVPRDIQPRARAAERSPKR
jgi:hypothetical protein